jgi:hypothetical protein
MLHVCILMYLYLFIHLPLVDGVVGVGVSEFDPLTLSESSVVASCACRGLRPGRKLDRLNFDDILVLFACAT